MALSDIISGALKGIVSPLAKVMEKREERKQAVATIRAETQRSATDGDVAVSLSKAQWEILSKQGETDTWKDEYITLVITSPILMIIGGSLQSAFGYGTEMLDAVSIALATMEQAGVELGPLMLYTVLAAIGIKAIR